MGFASFVLALQDNISFNLFHFSLGSITFVRLQQPGLSTATGFYKLDRLLQFTRAVTFSPPAGCRRIAAGFEWEELHRPCNRRNR